MLVDIYNGFQVLVALLVRRYAYIIYGYELHFIASDLNLMLDYG